MQRIFFYLIVLLLSSISLVQGQVEVIKVTPEVSVSQGVYLGKTIAVRDIVPRDKDHTRLREMIKKDKLKPPNFQNRIGGQSNAINLDIEHQGEDVLRQSGNLSSGGILIEPIVNIEGLDFNATPLDPSGDVGLDYFIQGINVTEVGVYSKDGTLVQQFSMDDLWSSLGETSAGDPIILYDERENRWLMTEFISGNAVLVGVSDSSDPLGTYNVYLFNTPSFPDYPKYGIWENEIVFTTNEGGPGTLEQYFLDKDALYSGAFTVTMQRVTVPGTFGTGQGFFVSTPIDVDGSLLPTDLRPIIARLNDSSWGDTAFDAVDMYRFNIDFSDPTNTSSELIRIATSPYDGFPCSVTGTGFQCVPQLGGDGLDAIPELIMNVPKYRNLEDYEAIVMTWITDVTDGNNLSGIRWMELRKEDEGEWELYQEGTYAPDDGLDRYMSSIAIDGEGNIGLGYNVSSNDTYVGVRYTGRRVDAPLGIMDVDEYNVVDGSNTINSFGRFGDYAQMSVDPVDERTFWYTTQYAGGGNATTRIVSFQVLRDSIDLAVKEIVTPSDFGLFSSNETVSIQVENSGTETIANYTVGYFLDNNLIDEITVATALEPDSTAVISIPMTADLSAIGEYELKAYVNHPADTRIDNDNLEKTIIHPYGKNVKVEVGQGELVCNSEIEVNYTVTNLGFDNATSMMIEITVNGGSPIQFPWTGDLAYQESEVITSPSISLNALGNNTIDVVATSVNGSSDENTIDNTATTNFDFDNTLTEISVYISTDGFGYETSWILEDANGNIVASEDSYPPNTETRTDHCIPAGACYSFTIFDSFGNGTCCDFGNGSYSIFGSDFEFILAATGDFGDQETQTFCVDSNDCFLGAQMDIVDDDGENSGSIMISSQGGVEPYMYSIDGGQSFQSSPLFENLESGTYAVLVTEASGDCEYEESVTVGSISSTQELDELPYEFTINPNPNNGYFNIEFEMKDLHAIQLRLQIIDINGQIIQSNKIGKFNNTYKSDVSLVAYPSGNYYIRLLDDRRSLAIKRVVKL